MSAIISWLKYIFSRLFENPLTQRVIRNSSYLFSAQSIGVVLSTGQSILSARLLGPVGAGAIELVTQFSSNVNRLTSFRMGELVISYVGEYEAENKPVHAAAAFKAAILLESASSLLAFGLILGLARIGAEFFADDVSLAPLFALYGLIVVANMIYESSNGLLQYFNRYRTIAAIQVGQSFVTLSLIVLVFLTNVSDWVNLQFEGLLPFDGELTALPAVILAYMAGKIILGGFMGFAALRQAHRTWGGRWWLTSLSVLSGRWRGLLRFAFSTNLTGTLTLLTRDSETLWLGALSSNAMVGYYKTARAILNFLIMPIEPLISTTFREAAREIAQRQWANVRYILRSASILASVWTLPASLGLVIFGRWVISLYGQEFLPISYYTIMIMLIGAIVNNILFWNRTILLPLGYPDFPTKVQFVGAIIKIGFIVWLIPTLGALGMALTYSGFLVGTVGILVWRTIRELTSIEERSPTAVGV
jgi:O-antigen/teichoic acid export membrane protein